MSPKHPTNAAVQAETLRTLATWIEAHPELPQVTWKVDVGSAETLLNDEHEIHDEEQAREALGAFARALGTRIDETHPGLVLDVTGKTLLTKPFPLWQENLEVSVRYEIDPDENKDYWDTQRANER